MTFLSPWLLLALAALPVLWWLLRVTPPAPRSQTFPAVRLLLGLESEQTSARTPPWLLMLRLAAAALLIIGLAGPLVGQPPPMVSHGLLGIVLDDGFAAAADWPTRLAAADRLAAGAERQARPVVLLTTAPDMDTAAPRVFGPMPAAELRALLPTLRPLPWPPDRAAAARLLRRLSVRPGAIDYIADGLTHGAAWPDFASALQEAGDLTVIAGAGTTGVLSAASTNEGWIVRLARAPTGTAFGGGVRAEAMDGRVLAHAILSVTASSGSGTTALTLPTELRNRVDRLSLEGTDGTTVTSAAAVVLLDESERRRPVGLVETEQPTVNAPLTGSAFFLRRALTPYAEWRQGSLESLLARPLSVVISVDHTWGVGGETEALRDWVERGGTLIRFAGPDLAQSVQDGAADPLLPVPLLSAVRQIGGNMSWSQPTALAPFSPDSPFSGLAVPRTGSLVADVSEGLSDVTVTRQVLADPAADLGGATWARLTDGTPLVTQRIFGRGRVVLFHVTANADWSNLPLSGLFVDMLRRLLALSAGVAGDTNAEGVLAPTRALDGSGAWASPGLAARPVAAPDWISTVASPSHPPGLYGPEGGRRVLNLSQGLADPVAAPTIEHGRLEPLAPPRPVRPLGPVLVALSALLLLIDLVASLGVRGLRAPMSAAVLLIVVAASPARADPFTAALATRLAAVRTGDDTLDHVAMAGLAGLSAYVNERTAVRLAGPVMVTPGQDDLSFYPLLYWPISADVPTLDGPMIAALNTYMGGGGVILIDTRDAGAGAATAGDGREVLRRLTSRTTATGLTAPSLAPLTSAHVLARSFYLLSEFPGRYDGEPVWVARDIDRSNDSVSPMVIGAHDWAAAWAVDDDGVHRFATLPGGERQRTLAYRFGVNLVMYSLTGNYKGDQVHVPALLQRLGQ